MVSATAIASPRADEEGITERHRVLNDIEEGDTILLAGATGTEANDNHCRNLLAPEGEPAENLVLVTLTGNPRRRIETVTSHLESLPESITVIAAGGYEGSRSADVSAFESDVNVESIADPGDLSQLGLTISGVIADLDHDQRTVFCLTSLTALLQYVDLPRVYRFLHTLMARLRSANVGSHYHIDPSAHDDKTMATLRPLFDHVVTVDEVKASE